MSKKLEDLVAHQASALAKIQHQIKERSPFLQCVVEGQLFWLRKAESDLTHSAPAWVLQAHKGTLDKLQRLYLALDPKRGVELVALARNLFENLIWLELFNRNVGYGLLFYLQLLRSQMQSQEQAIAQAKDEIELFKEADMKDCPNLDLIDQILDEHAADPDGASAKVRAHIDGTMSHLDEDVGRTFSLYAHQAKFNGYGYQAHLLETTVIPQHEARRRLHQDSLDKLKLVLPHKLSPALLAESEARWNWKTYAQKVGISADYRFIYAYTSRLLHSGPLNIVTAKDLGEDERFLLLEYIRVAVNDVHTAIDQFQFPGQVKMVMVGSP